MMRHLKKRDAEVLLCELIDTSTHYDSYGTYNAATHRYHERVKKEIIRRMYYADTWRFDRIKTRPKKQVTTKT